MKISTTWRSSDQTTFWTNRNLKTVVLQAFLERVAGLKWKQRNKLYFSPVSQLLLVWGCRNISRKLESLQDLKEPQVSSEHNMDLIKVVDCLDSGQRRSVSKKVHVTQLQVHHLLRSSSSTTTLAGSLWTSGSASSAGVQMNWTMISHDAAVIAPSLTALTVFLNVKLVASSLQISNRGSNRNIYMSVRWSTEHLLMTISWSIINNINPLKCD